MRNVQRVRLEVLDVDGVVVEGRTLRSGRWLLGSTKRVAVTVGAGGCWVEGPRSALQVNDVATERAELHEADVLSFDDERLRVWPSDTPEEERKPLEVAARHRGVRGLVVQLWWHDELVEQWRTFEATLSPPVTLFALAGYESLTESLGGRADDSYRIFVPEGCEASEPLINRYATVPAMRPLTIARGDLRLRFELTATDRPSRWRRAGAWAAVMASVGWLLGLCATSMLEQTDPFERMTRFLLRDRPVHLKMGKNHAAPSRWQPGFGRLVEHVHFKDGHLTSVPDQQVFNKVKESLLASRSEWLQCQGSTPGDQVRTVSWSVGLWGDANPTHSDDPVVSCLNDVLSKWVFSGADGRDFSFSFAFREIPVPSDRDAPHDTLNMLLSKRDSAALLVPRLVHLASSPRIVGALDHGQVTTMLQKKTGEVEYCLVSNLGGEPPPKAATVNVTLVISPDGWVSSALASSSVANAQGVEACIAEHSHRWIFPRPRDGREATVKVGFAFVNSQRE